MQAAAVAARRLAHRHASTSSSDTLIVGLLVGALRARGHLHARLDPLGRPPAGRGVWLGETRAAADRAAEWRDPLLDRVLAAVDAGAGAPTAASLAAALRLPGGEAAGRATYDLSAAADALPGGLPFGRAAWALPDLVASLARAYASTLAVELDHLPAADQAWLAARVETAAAAGPGWGLCAGARKRALTTLAAGSAFESFLGAAFPRSKRFGIEGLDALAPGLEAAADRFAAAGVTTLQIGTPHRGRLTLLATVLGTPAGQIMAEMEAAQSEWQVGDVKYHLGKGAALEFLGDGQSGARLHASVAPNPSHLEAVAPVVLGMVRAQQAALGRSAVAALQVHGDAAFAGLGVVAETLAMARVPGFNVGGTVHIVANNQVGFTTAPLSARSSPHATDSARAAGAPILHANADDPDAVIAACKLAADWRAARGRDVVVDVVGYRRRGHNEQDDPSSSSPATVAAIGAHPPVLTLYSAKLVGEGVVEAGAAEAAVAAAAAALDAEHDAFAAGSYSQTAADWLKNSWQGDALASLAAPVGPGGVAQRREPTGLPAATLRMVGVAACTPPPGFTPPPQAAAALARRAASLAGDGARVDFATAEALALGSLALHRDAVADDNGAPGAALSRRPAATPTRAARGAALADAAAASGLNAGAYGVRLVGQDAERGTFGQRHAVVRDEATGERAVLLAGLATASGLRQEPVEVWNSPLNEAACLSFEYGHSLGAAGRALSIWEAQFGDFANNAQAAIDVFVAAAEERWGQQSGLVLLLPHGFDGAGPDHSSARLERFLQLANDDGDALPGDAAREAAEAGASFDAVAGPAGGVRREDAGRLLAALGAADAPRAAQSLWDEAGLTPDQSLDRARWTALMRRFLRRNAEARANLFVVAPSTPAQLFHALRRQLNRAAVKPLIVAAPKRLHVHAPATSALGDLGPGTRFARVIDDGAAADNTRHRAAHPTTGDPFMVPPDQVRRLLLVSGQLYYALSAARRSRRVRDVALARVEQLTPFPYDDVTAVLAKYAQADVVWVQVGDRGREGKGQGGQTDRPPNPHPFLCRRSPRTRAPGALCSPAWRRRCASWSTGAAAGAPSATSAARPPAPPRPRPSPSTATRRGPSWTPRWGRGWCRRGRKGWRSSERGSGERDPRVSHPLYRPSACSWAMRSSTPAPPWASAAAAAVAAARAAGAGAAAAGSEYSTPAGRGRPSPPPLPPPPPSPPSSAVHSMPHSLSSCSGAASTAAGGGGGAAAAAAACAACAATHAGLRHPGLGLMSSAGKKSVNDE